jgi:glucose-1-phosphate thymidylyltransferase
MGTAQGLSHAGDFVRIIQERQNLLVASPEDVARNMGFISKDGFEQLADSLPAGPYKDSLKNSL